MAKSRNRIRQSRGDTVLDVIFYAFLTLLAILCFYPVWYVLVASVSDSNYVNSGALVLYPVGMHFKGYEYILTYKDLWTGYKNTIIYVTCGTLLGLGVSIPAGYALSRKDLPGRGLIMGVLVFTMYFGGGLIPTYLVVKTLGLTNTRWILILFGSISVYNVILIRTFCASTLPSELREAAVVDGCSNTRFLFQFVFPLSKAIIAVIGMYIAVGHWNSYFNALVYTTDKALQPLQLILRTMLFRELDLNETTDTDLIRQQSYIVQVIKYAVIVVSTLPIMCIYPFLQKYFVQGVMIGSLKG